MGGREGAGWLVFLLVALLWVCIGLMQLVSGFLLDELRLVFLPLGFTSLALAITFGVSRAHLRGSRE